MGESYASAYYCLQFQKQQTRDILALRVKLEKHKDGRTTAQKNWELILLIQSLRFRNSRIKVSEFILVFTNLK